MVDTTTTQATSGGGKSPSFVYTVKHVNKSNPRERRHMVFIDKWPYYGGYVVLINQ